MTAPSETHSHTTTSASRRRHVPPNPNSILDRPALIRRLEELGWYGSVVKSIHVDTFYQALHRQHYPDLPTFVKNYHRYEQERQQQQKRVLQDAPQPYASPEQQEETQHRLPLKNSISNKKNKNKLQLPHKFLEYLSSTTEFVTVTSRVVQSETCADQTTTKLIIALHDEFFIESVLMRYDRHEQSIRASLCVSSQCGCAMGCTFCATGTMGWSGNLTTGEILEQIVHADRILAEEWKIRPNPRLELVRNVVFMGMGEPLDNYQNVIEACRALIDTKRWNLAHKGVTVSTVGIVSKIRQLTKDLPEVSLALSLHAPNQAMRQAIVPTAKHYPIEQLIDALDHHMMACLQLSRKKQAALKNGKNATASQEEKRTLAMEYTIEERQKESSRRRAMIEYVMLEGDTSTDEAAHQLGKLCEGRHLLVNLIPYNATNVQDPLHCPSLERMNRFRDIVASYGTYCTIRRTMGADIDSACGQLITAMEKKTTKGTNNGQQGKTDNHLTDIEDVVADGTKNPAQKLTANKSTVGTKSKRRMESNEIKQWIRPLTLATVISASCFVASSILYAKQRQRR